MLQSCMHYQQSRIHHEGFDLILALGFDLFRIPGIWYFLNSGILYFLYSRIPFVSCLRDLICVLSLGIQFLSQEFEQFLLPGMSYPKGFWFFLTPGIWSALFPVYLSCFLNPKDLFCVFYPRNMIYFLLQGFELFLTP